MWKLTNDQQKAYDNIIDFINNKSESCYILTGSAGTGKTFLIKNIIKNLIGHVCVGICPTHKAKKILSTSILPYFISTSTIASILSKIKEHSYIGTKNFSNANNLKLDKFTFFILDEVSMISDIDLKYIIDYVIDNKKKLLIIGDPYQIPCPSTYSVIKSGNYCYKSDSYIFTTEKFRKTSLKEIVRQHNESDIINLATFYRDNIDKEVSLIDFIRINNLDINILNVDEMINTMSEIYKNNININERNHVYNSMLIDKCRCICYTNAIVYKLNRTIREKLFGIECEKFYKGEILTAYNSLGYPQYYIENGNDYIIENVKYMKNYKLNNVYCELEGHVVKLNNVDQTLFFINVECKDIQVLNFINELITRAIKVNSNHSTLNDYIKYNELRNKVIFSEDIYKYENTIYSKYKFKKLFPIFFNKTHDIFNNDKLLNNMKTKYPHLIINRKNDNKIVSDNETFADQFMVIEKDIDYGYSITAHKSQGSTYENVFVFDNDYNKIIDRYNYKFSCTEIRTKEKNQLKYVAITRASKNLYIVNDENFIIE